MAVGDDLTRTCTCGIVTWDRIGAPYPRKVVAYDPARREDDGSEVMVSTVHNFDGSPCFVE